MQEALRRLELSTDTSARRPDRGIRTAACRWLRCHPDQLHRGLPSSDRRYERQCLAPGPDFACRPRAVDAADGVYRGGLAGRRGCRQPARRRHCKWRQPDRAPVDRLTDGASRRMSGRCSAGWFVRVSTICRGAARTERPRWRCSSRLIAAISTLRSSGRVGPGCQGRARGRASRCSVRTAERGPARLRRRLRPSMRRHPRRISPRSTSARRMLVRLRGPGMGPNSALDESPVRFSADGAGFSRCAAATPSWPSARQADAECRSAPAAGTPTTSTSKVVGDGDPHSLIRPDIIHPDPDRDAAADPRPR